MKVSQRWVIFITMILGAQGLGRQKRSVKQFGAMVRARTILSLSDFNGYGNFCGFKGSGIPVDNIDRCCEAHDSCLRLSNRQDCKPLFYLSFFFVPYQWQHLISTKFNLIACSSTNSRCQQALCECDKEAAECFALYQNEYNPGFKKNKRLYIF